MSRAKDQFLLELIEIMEQYGDIDYNYINQISKEYDEMLRRRKEEKQNEDKGDIT